MKHPLKYIIMAAIVTLGAADSTWADTNFRWSPLSNSLNNASSSKIAISNATVLTFLSDDQTVNALSMVVGGKLTLQDTYGDDVFYKAQSTVNAGPPGTGNGRYITNYMLETGDAHVGKYVYAIILDSPWSLYTAFEEIPKNGTINAAITSMGKDASVVKPLSAYPTFPQQSFDGGSVQTTLSVIPEPTSAVLILMAGIGAIVMRRRSSLFVGKKSDSTRQDQ